MSAQISRILSLIFILFSISAFSQTRYWVAGAGANWSGDNWAASSGGLADGGGPPTALQSARFDANGLGNCTVDALDPSIAGLIVNGYTGIIDLNGNTVTATGTVTLSSGTINDTPGTDSLVVNASGTTTFNGTTLGAIVHVTSRSVGLSGSTFNARSTFIKNGTGNVTGTGGNTFNGSVYLGHTSANNYILAGTNPDDFNGDLTINNSGTGTIYLSYTAAGNTYDGNITLNSTGSSAGILFGNNGGTSTLADTYTVAIGGSGFSNGTLRLRGFTQTGTTAQTLTLTGTTTTLDIYDSNWGGDVTFSSPRITTRGTTYSGTSSLTKTAGGDNRSAGGNTFTGNCTLINTGSNELSMGDGSPDTFSGDLTLNNNGTDHIFIAYNSAGNTIGGNLMATNSGTGTSYIYLSNAVASSLTVTGTTTLINNGSGTTNNIYLGNTGDVTLGSSLSITNNPTGTSGTVYVANANGSIVTIAGNTTVTNSGANTTKRVYLGEQGDVTFTGTLSITNSSSANNSQVYCNNNVNSVNVYSESITLEVTDANCDGIFFGNSAGSGTLAATKSVSIGGGGYIGLGLTFRNFTQTGATAQTLAPSGTVTNFIIYDCNWGGDVVFSSPRITTRGTTYSGTASLTKTGATDDRSAGGNTFTGNATLIQTGSREFSMGNGSPDTFSADLTLNNNGTQHMHIGYNSAGNTVAGNLTATNSATGTAHIYLSNNAASSLTVTGTTTIINNASGTSNLIYLGGAGDVTLNNNLSITNSSTGTTGNIYVANSDGSIVTIAGNTTVTNSGANTTKRIYLGEQGDITFNGTLSITNSSSATNSQVYCNNNVNSVNAYNENITLEVTHASCDGIFFGNSAGSGTLADTKTISVGGGGYIGAGALMLRNFTQTGATAQALSITGTNLMTIYDCAWGGNVVFSAPQLLTRGTTYSGTASLTKNGATNSQSVGGNTFTGNTTLSNSGSGTFMMGNGSPDTFGGDLNINLSGSNHFYLGQNSAGNTVAGNLTATHTGTGTSHIYLSNAAASTLDITGTTTLNNTSSGSSSNIYLGNTGDVTLGSSLSMTNAVSGAAGNNYIATADGSVVTITGNTTIINSGSGTTKRTYLGEQGDVTFNGTLSITNSSNATNSEVYCNNNVNSVNVYNQDIILEVTHASSDGILFGNANGNGTIAATRTISIGAGGFIGSFLTLRNFTQVGATAQILQPSGTTTYMTIYDCNWGGNIDFSSAQMQTRGTTYSGTTSLEKTGAADNTSNGNNTFTGNATLVNSGSGFFRMGTTNPDTFSGDLDITNSGSRHFYLGYNSAGNTVAGNLTVTNSGTGSSDVYLSDETAATLVVTGTAVITNSASGTTSNVYLGDDGDITFSSSLTLTNSSSATTGQIFLADGANSTAAVTGNIIATNSGAGGTKRIYLGNAGPVTFSGDVTLSNSNTATTGEVYIGNGSASIVTISGNTTLTNDGSGTTRRAWLGNGGDVSFGGTISVTNNSTATNSEVYFHDDATSVNTYAGDITLSSNSADCDGVYFGNSTGSGTLAATRTISIGGGGFLADFLYLRNFTQIGATAQTLQPAGSTTYMTLYDCNWGGDIIFSAAQMLTRGTTYSGTASLTKTGATDNNSTGGNTFVGNAILNNSGSGYFQMGNGSPDIFGADLDINLSGSDHFYLAYNSAGNTVAGNFTATHTGTGSSYIYLSDQSAATLAITGTAVITNSATGITNYIYVGNAGDLTFGSNLTLTNSSTSTTGQIYLADDASSTVSIAGNTIATNSGAGGTKRIYLGNAGPATFGGDVTLSNSNTATTGELYLGNGVASIISISGNTTLTNDGSGTTRRAWLGNAGDVSFGGTLTITNNSDATNSEVYLQDDATSVNTYAGDITLVSTSSDCDGVYFGNSTGSGTLAATRTISIGGGGFLADFLTIRNFTQVGATAQTLHPAGPTTYMTLYDCNWGGDIDFSAAQMLTRGTTYSGTASLEKTGATDNNSVGGNTFIGNAILNNSGSGYFRMGSGSPDIFGGDLDITNSGSRHFYLGFNSAGNTVGGNLTVTNSGTGSSDIYLSDESAATLAVTGTAIFTNSATGTSSTIYVGDDGDITFGSDITLINSSSATTGQIFIADASTSLVTVAGNAIATNSGSGGTKNIYLGNVGDVTFSGDLTITNSTDGTSGQVLLASNAASEVTVAGNTISINSGINGTKNVYLGNSGDATFSGDLTITNSTNSTTGQTFLADDASSIVSVGGNTIATNSGAGTTKRIYLGNDGSVSFGGDLTLSNSNTATTGELYVGDGSTSITTIVGNTTLTNDGSGTTRRAWLGNAGDVSFGGTLSITNNSDATNSEVYLQDDATSVNTYAGDITLVSTSSDCDGVYFGNSTGSGTLAATRTISIGGSGFLADFLTIRNFTQVGATAQTLHPAGPTTYLTLYDCNWGGDIDFSAAQILSRGTTYSGTASLEKTGATDNSSAGGNTFVGNATLTNSGSGYFLMGNNGNPDTFGGDLDMICTGSDHLYLAYNSAGNTVAGNFTATNSGTGTSHIYLSDQTASTLTITGTATITNPSSGTTNYIYIGNAGDITFNGSLTLNNPSSSTTGNIYLADDASSSVSVAGNTIVTNNSTGGTNRIYLGNVGPVTFSGDLTLSNSNTSTTGEIYLASNAASSVSISGNTTLINDGAGTTRRTYLGSSGDVSFGGTLAITNSSTATNSQVYCNNAASSVNSYAGNITLESTSASTDGILFGNSNGSGTLAATRTITIGGGGFIAGNLTLRNFTQVGATAQALHPTGTSIMLVDDSNWGGDVDFSSPRLDVEGSTFSRTASLDKTGSGDDRSAGGNTFVGNATIINSGSGYWRFGEGTTDDFNADLNLINSGTNHLYFAYSGAGHLVSGNLTATNSSTGVSYLYLGNATSSTLTVNGTSTFINSGNGSDCRIYAGNSGDVTFNDDVTITNSASGNQGLIYMANGTDSEITVNGNTTVTNSEAVTTKRVFLGNQGDVTYNGTLSISNSSTATNSQVYCNYEDNSANVYNGNITIESTSASNDGILFGNSGGAGTLAATRTISIGGGGFIGSALYFRDFTQTGATAQTLEPTGITTFTLYESNWGGDVTFSSARLTSRSCIYSSTASLEKNGASNDDWYGSNTFNGATTITHSGTGRWRISSSVGDVYADDVSYIKTGSGTFEPARNGTSTYAGNINFNLNSLVTFATNNGIMEMIGTAAQSINDLGASTEPRFRRLVLNNPNDEVTLNTPIEISTSITFTQGNMITTDANLLTIRDEALALTASDASYVRGPIEKVGEDDFTFPVGDSGLYRPMTISGGSGRNNSTAFSGSYFEVNPDTSMYSRSSREGTLDHVSASEYWILDRTNGTATVDVTLSWDSNSGTVDNLSELRVAKWNSISSEWEDEGNGGTTGNTTEGTIITSSAVSSFSPFTLSSTTSNNPLPIELTSFDAKIFNQQVKLIWETASEINNNYFTIERSVDGKNFEFVTTVKGAGNSNVGNTYSTYDSAPLYGTSYYRLTQTDFDGTTVEEGLTSISFTNRKTIPFKVYPNPVTNHNINLEWNSLKVADCLIVIYNLKGERLQEKIITSNEGTNHWDLILNPSIHAGNYILAVYEAGKLMEKQPLIIQ